MLFKFEEADTWPDGSGNRSDVLDKIGASIIGRIKSTKSVSKVQSAGRGQLESSSSKVGKS